MIRRDIVDREIQAWVADQDQSRATYLEEVLAVTSRTRQRAAWSFPGRWIPMDLTMRRAFAPPALRYLALLVVIVLAVAAAAVVIVGSRRAPAPPYGLAANGVIAYTSPDQDIATIDPVTNEMKILVGGPDLDRTPVFSRDGSRVAFNRITPEGSLLLAVDASGGTPVQLTTTARPNLDEVTWSPDGSRIAFATNGEIAIVSTDGSGALTMLPLGDATRADSPAWRPPDGREILFRGIEDEGYRLFLGPADGRAEPTPLTAFVEYEFGWYFATFTPDGTQIMTQRDVHAGQCANLLSLGPGGPRIVDERLTAPCPPTTIAPQLSPDGTRVALAFPQDDQSGRIGVVSIDEPGSRKLIGPPDNGGIDWGYAWSPDGASLIHWLTKEDRIWILDADGGPVRVPEWPGVRDADWQRRAP